MPNTVDLILDEKLSPKVAVVYAMLFETRNQLLREISDLTQEQLDYSPNITKVETIGTLLFHIAAIEFSWFFEDIYGEEFKEEEWKYALALRYNFEPPQLKNKPLSFYMEKLQKLRERVYITLQQWKDVDLNQPVKSDDYYYTKIWILHHIQQHESHHIGQINFLKRLFKNSKEI